MTTAAARPRRDAVFNDAPARNHEIQDLSNLLPIDFADDLSMGISHEAIYQSLFIDGRGSMSGAGSPFPRTSRHCRDMKRC